MKGLKKVVTIAAVLIVVLLAVLIAAFSLFGESAIETGIETAAARALGVNVHIDDVGLSLLRGKVEIAGLIVENPPGYAHQNLLELARTNVTMRIGSLLKDTVRIEEIKLDGINLVIEQKTLSNNLNDIIKSLPKGEEKEKEPEPAAKKLQIDNLEVTNIKVKVKLLPVPGKADTIPLQIDDIKMTNLGSDNKLSTAVLTEKILVAIATAVAKQGVGILPDDIVNSMQSTLNVTAEAALKEAEKIIDKGTDVIEGIKGLFKPKKEN